MVELHLRHECGSQQLGLLLLDACTHGPFQLWQQVAIG
jgi:hypothetical protein